jgi:hypothetical protein
VKKASDAFFKNPPCPESISRIMEKEEYTTCQGLNSNTVVGNAVQFLGLYWRWERDGIWKLFDSPVYKSDSRCHKSHSFNESLSRYYGHVANKLWRCAVTVPPLIFWVVILSIHHWLHSVSAFAAWLLWSYTHWPPSARWITLSLYTYTQFLLPLTCY